MKDAADFVASGRSAELVRALWDAKEWRPDGVVNAADLIARIAEPVELGLPYPWEPLNGLTYGLRPGEIVTLCAGSGIGKSAVVAEIAYHLLVGLEQAVGYVALEENVQRSGRRFAGIHLNAPIHLPGHSVPEADVHAAAEAVLGTRRLWLYDHFGSLDSDRLMSRMRYMVKGCEVRWLVLDHLSIVVSGMDLSGDERRQLDHTMTVLRQFTEETGVGLLLVSHLKRPHKRGHEEGAKVSLDQLRGSAAIAQLSDIVIGLERNQQARDERARNLTTVRILKNRYAGLTGPVCGLSYNHTTGRLSEAPLPTKGDDTPPLDEELDDEDI